MRIEVFKETHIFPRESIVTKSRHMWAYCIDTVGLLIIREIEHILSVISLFCEELGSRKPSLRYLNDKPRQEEMKKMFYLNDNSINY